jgi:nicotinamide phosphoribosyltransferase
MHLNSMLLCDFYKICHRIQYPNKTEVVYSTWTPRASKMKDVNEVVVFGLQAFIKDRLQGLFDRNFFQKKKEEVVSDYARIISGTLGIKSPDTKHIEDLHDLGYLPLCIRALPEGSVAPLRTPMITIHNTDPRFFWLTNYIETLMSCELWQPSTSATIAREYRKRFNEWAIITGSPTDFIKFQGHDFSMRGMSSLMSAINSGMGHLLSFYGTDTIPAIQGAEYLYGADVTKEVIGLSVPATEHSIQCTYGDDTQYIKDMITKVHPSGIVSVVSDGYDFWKVMTEILPSLKEEIMSRDGKLVIRPDSGDPVKIVCGDPEGKTEAERKGAVQILWETFGGTRNAKGYGTLNEHIGLIYGDAITLRRAEDILQSLAEKGFAANNVVFGIGSYCVSPDTPILCSDLVWRKAGEIEVGQEIIAFDENPTFGEGRHAARCYKKATIKSNIPAKKICSRISTDIGDPIVASDDHPWLVWTENRSKCHMYIDDTERANIKDASGNSANFPKTPGLAWKRTYELQVGDQIAFLAKPWEKENTSESGWLEGIFDGEGCVSRSTGDHRIPSWKVNISQNKGYVLDRIEKELVKRRFAFHKNDRTCPQIVLTGGWVEVLRFLGTISPKRLLNKLVGIVDNMPALKRNYTFQTAVVQQIESLGISDVASIETSSGTFITGGYLSHNTYQYNTRDTFGFALKSTLAVIDGKEIQIFKDPKTDDGVKKSQKGRVIVLKDGDSLKSIDGFSLSDVVSGDQLMEVYRDGQLKVEQTFSEIRERLWNNAF